VCVCVCVCVQNQASIFLVSYNHSSLSEGYLDGVEVSLHKRNMTGKALAHAIKAHERVEINLPLFLVSTLDGGLSVSHSRCFSPQKETLGNTWTRTRTHKSKDSVWILRVLLTDGVWRLKHTYKRYAYSAGVLEFAWRLVVMAITCWNAIATTWAIEALKWQQTN